MAHRPWLGYDARTTLAMSSEAPEAMLSTPASSASSVSAPPKPPASKGRALLLFVAKLVVTGAALAFAFSRVSLADLADGVRKLSATALVLAVALTVGNLMVGAVRWRILLAAYGAKYKPSIPFLFRAQLVGHFYNTFVPGNVGGDVLRAHVTRSSFDGPLGSYMVVAQERFFGLSGLTSLAAMGLLLYPLPGVISPTLLGALALVAGVVIVTVPVAGRSIGAKLPGRLGRWAASLPQVAKPGFLGAVFCLSLVAHAVVAVTGYLLVSALAPQVAMSQALVLVPVAMAAMYVPSVAGLGVREAGFVFLFGRIGVSAAAATVASLSFFAIYGLVAVLGGLVHLMAPLKERDAPDADAA